MNDKKKLDEIFDVVASITDSVERAQRLNELCAGDAKLRDEVQDLLQRDQQIGSFLEEHSTDAIRAADDTQGDMADIQRVEIPNYRLEKKIGQGGMGAVWAAEQIKPVRRRVAIKVIRDGQGSKQIISRFEAERQALAMMDNDPGGIDSIINAGGHSIANLVVNLDISHQRPSDLDVILVGLNGGSPVQLFNFSGDNNVTEFNGSSTSSRADRAVLPQTI